MLGVRYTSEAKGRRGEDGSVSWRWANAVDLSGACPITTSRAKKIRLHFSSAGVNTVLACGSLFPPSCASNCCGLVYAKESRSSYNTWP